VPVTTVTSGTVGDVYGHGNGRIGGMTTGQVKFCEAPATTDFVADGSGGFCIGSASAIVVGMITVIGKTL
jgi:hypothetical protein